MIPRIVSVTKMTRLLLHKSWLEAWIDCPMKYKLTVQNNVPTEPTVEMQIGLHFHEFARDFYTYMDWETLPMIDTYDDCIEFFKWFVPRDLPELVKPLAMNFIEHEARRWIECRRLYDDPLEVFKPVFLEETFVARDVVPGVDMEGTIDRIDRTSLGTLVIIEYKTGRKLRVRDVKRELAFYVLLVQGSGRVKDEITHIAAYNPRTNEEFCQPVTRRLLQMTRQRILQIQKAHELDYFPPRESFRCAFCHVKEFCPLWTNSNYSTPGGD